MAKTDARVFKLVDFSPVGFKVMNYPVQFCSLCRGYLSDPCSNCIENNNDKCTVTNQNNSYYHTHCFTFMNADVKKPIGKKKKGYSSDDSF